MYVVTRKKPRKLIALKAIDGNLTIRKFILTLHLTFLRKM